MGTFTDAVTSGAQAAEVYAVAGDALEEMEGMCGNNGQSAIIAIGTDAFMSWVDATIEAASDPDGGDAGDLEDYLSFSLSDEQLDATDEIWSVGESMVNDAVQEELLDEGDEDQGEVGFSEAPSVDFVRFRGETPAEEEKRRRQYEREKGRFNFNRGKTRFFRGAAGEVEFSFAERAAMRAIARRIVYRAVARAARRAVFRGR